MPKTTNTKEKTETKKKPEVISGVNPFAGISRFGNQTGRYGAKEEKAQGQRIAPARPTFITQHKGGN